MSNVVSLPSPVSHMMTEDGKKISFERVHELFMDGQLSVQEFKKFEERYPPFKSWMAYKVRHAF